MSSELANLPAVNTSRPAASSNPPGAGREQSPERIRLARLPIRFLIFAVGFFAIGVLALPWLVGDLVEFFYQARVLALVHTFTLGWITAAMMGVMYRYVPALTKRPIRFPRLAGLQFYVFAIGAAGMISHFLIGRWEGTAFAAIMLLLGIVLFAINMSGCLAPVWRRGVAEMGMLLAVLFLFLAAFLGVLLALDKIFDFLHGNVIRNAGAHAHLAALGWVSLTICAVSYRMLPAFLLPELTLPRAATWQLSGLAAATVLLAASLLGAFGGTRIWSIVAAGAMLAYLPVLWSVVSTRRMPIDWTVRHALAGASCLVFCAALGVTLSWIDPGSELGNRITATYGTLGLLGWVSNFIVGMSLQLGPGFVTAARSAAGLPALAIAELSVARVRPLVFSFLQIGILLLAVGLLGGNIRLARLGASSFALGGLVYAVVMEWILSFAYRRSLPRSAKNPPRILPTNVIR